MPSVVNRYNDLLGATEGIDDEYTLALEVYKNLRSMAALFVEAFNDARATHRVALENERQLEQHSIPALALDMESAAARL